MRIISNIKKKFDPLKKIQLEERTKTSVEKRMILKRFYSKQKYGSFRKMNKIDKLNLLCDFYFQGVNLYKKDKRIQSYKQALENYSKQLFLEYFNKKKYLSAIEISKKYSLKPEIFDTIFIQHLQSMFLEKKVDILKNDLNSKKKALKKYNLINKNIKSFEFIKEYINYNKFDSNKINNYLKNILNYFNKNKDILQRVAYGRS
ncbi:MAG: hypothetical protein PHR26_02835 [Candidatus ainarchaeum sp.]|nr:hypothetical protein [Candidatus ainarchaeum sp.]MDD3975936.1 hypothetical protein [Candidatus ainarchaeum sp.]